MVSSYPGFRFEYGYVSMVAQIPTGTGLWSGLWLAATNLKWPPEIDMLERWGPPRNITAAYFHPVGTRFTGVHLSQALAAQTATGWHTYSVMWTETQITWYVDNQQVFVVTKNVPHQAMYLLADLADYVTGACTGQLAIRSIDVWQG
jgi:beta-glucanase (GH16 family)